MNKEYYIKLIIRLEMELKQTKSKDNKIRIKKEIKKLRNENHITVYDKLKWLGGNNNESSNLH